MKTLFTLLATALMVNFAIAQGQTARTAAVKTVDILSLKESVYDFGKIQQGRPVTHDFEFLNTSPDTLKIEDVKASCGCTTPVWQKTPVAPNKGSRITVGYNAYNEGPFEKTVTVLYNGGQAKLITIKGNVYKAPGTAAPENNGIQSLKQSNQ